MMNKKSTAPVPNKPRDKSFNFLMVFVILFVVLVGRALFNRADTVNSLTGEITKPVEMNFSDVITATDAKKIGDISIKGNNAVGSLIDGTPFNATFVYDTDMLTKISESGAAVTIDSSKTWTDYLATWIPILMGMLLIWWIFRGFRVGGAAGGIPLSKYNPTKITTGQTKTTFKDIAGIDSEKQEVMEIVEFLKHPDKFKALGARVPRGVLLSGEPGTGKTLLARAIAGEANVPFFASSGSDFSGIIVGLGVAKIKELFEMAKRNAPCILFLDEIDAIGQHRGRGGFNDQDREQTLNQLLIEMDGFSNDNGIIVIGATNRLDMLDKALLRPGRFDRQVHIELPDLKGRLDILVLYAKKYKISGSVDLKEVARGTTGFSGADLENLLNESALHAARDNHLEIEPSDIEEARDKTIMGPKKNKKMRAEDIRRAAYHEAGHAYLSIHYRDITDPIHKATIIPRGIALGMVQHLPIDDKVSLTRDEIKANLSIFMAGRAAEEIFFGANKVTTGAESDIAAATRMARYSITTAGLSDRIGAVAVNQFDAGWGAARGLEKASEKTAELVDEEVKSWIDFAHKDATKFLEAGKDTVSKLAEELLLRETLSREEIEEIVLGKKTSSKKPAKKITPKKSTLKKSTSRKKK